MSKKGNLYLAAISILVYIPSVLSAATIIPCDGVDCEFSDLVVLAQNIIDYLLFYIAMPLAAVTFAIAGFMLMFAKGNESKVTMAKSIFWYVLWGLVVALSAWLVVEAIASALGIDRAFWLLNS